MSEMSKKVWCGVCHGERDYTLLPGAMVVSPCKNGCLGSAIIGHSVMTDSLSTMIEQLDALTMSI